MLMLMVLKNVEMLGPTDLPLRIATAISPIRRPYSTAEAPDWSVR
jgi:hypothetical protein